MTRHTLHSLHVRKGMLSANDREIRGRTGRAHLHSGEGFQVSRRLARHDNVASLLDSFGKSRE